MKTASLPNQSTSETPSASEPTQTLPDPGRTQRVAWTPPNTALRLSVTPGGGPQPDRRDRRYLLRGAAALLLTLLVLWCLPLPLPDAKRPAVAPAVVPHLVQHPSASLEPLLPPLYRSHTGSDPSVRVFLVAPSVPIPGND